MNKMNKMNLLKQAQQLKQRMEAAQKEIESLRVEGSSDRGSIKVMMTGDKLLSSIEIDPKFLSSSNTVELEQHIVSAINEASKKAEKQASKKMKSLTGGFKIPGLGF
jgi:DNA-binding YbaB/EbfC family protein|tara:strand:+ start:289 stop:609 length:321 start_codon:yes stop_codon:yes gene_type:complete